MAFERDNKLKQLFHQRLDKASNVAKEAVKLKTPYRNAKCREIYHACEDIIAMSREPGASDDRVWGIIGPYQDIVGHLIDWYGTATDHCNVAPAPDGLRDYPEVTSLAQIVPASWDTRNISSAELTKQEHANLLAMNEIGKVVNALVLLTARLLGQDFDYLNRQLFLEQVQYFESSLVHIMTGVFSPILGQDRMQQLLLTAGRLGILRHAALQVVFWCEISDNPACIHYLRKGGIPKEIPHPCKGQGPNDKPLKEYPQQQGHELTNGHHYPLQQLISLIYLGLAEVVAAGS